MDGRPGGGATAGWTRIILKRDHAYRCLRLGSGGPMAEGSEWSKPVVGPVSHNLFGDPLPTADDLVMGYILRDWDLRKKRLLFERAREALQ